MTSFPVEGGCHCRAVRYTLKAPAMSVQHCHCSRCRTLYGQLFATGAVIRRADLAVEGSGNLAEYLSSPSFLTKFCRVCGCHLFEYEASEPDLMYFFPATLDGGVHPGHPAGKECHIYVGSRSEWEHLSDELPKYDTTSPDEIISDMQRANREGA